MTSVGSGVPLAVFPVTLGLGKGQGLVVVFDLITYTHTIPVSEINEVLKVWGGPRPSSQPHIKAKRFSGSQSENP